MSFYILYHYTTSCDILSYGLLYYTFMFMFYYTILCNTIINCTSTTVYFLFNRLFSTHVTCVGKGFPMRAATPFLTTASEFS